MKPTTSQLRRMRIVLSPSLSFLNARPADLAVVNVLVFPELVDGGYRALARGEGRHSIGDPVLKQVRQMSRNLSCLCVAGTVALTNPTDQLTNTCLVYQRGRLVHRYDKIHLFRPTGDTQYFAPGQTIGTFSLAGVAPGLRAGVIVCYDLRFPELTRTLADSGISILFVPARWPAVRDDAWRTLLKARAIENQIFVVGCNARGREGGFSYVFDPAGRVVFSSRVHPGDPYHIVDLDLADLDNAKRLHNNLAEARLLHASTIPHHLKGGPGGPSGLRK